MIPTGEGFSSSSALSLVIPTLLGGPGRASVALGDIEVVALKAILNQIVKDYSVVRSIYKNPSTGNISIKYLITSGVLINKQIQCLYNFAHHQWTGIHYVSGHSGSGAQVQALANQIQNAALALRGGIEKAHSVTSTGPEAAILWAVLEKSAALLGYQVRRFFYLNDVTHNISIGVKVSSGPHTGKQMNSVLYADHRWSGLTGY